MAVLVIILIVGVIVGCVVWNHRNANLARSGVEFNVAHPPAAVSAAISAAFCHGKRAKVKSSLSTVKVEPGGQNRFITGTKLGDRGFIRVTDGGDGCSKVTVAADQLFIGADTRAVEGCGGCYGQVSNAFVSGLWSILGIAPNGGKFHRWQQRVEGRVQKELQRQAR